MSTPNPAPKAVPPVTKKGKAKAEKKEGAAKRSQFGKLYPEDKKITLKVKENPKKEGSKARARFDHYASSTTVGDYLSKGGTYQDIAYDVGRGFIAVG
jgi:hypothetical protein